MGSIRTSKRSKIIIQIRINLIKQKVTGMFRKNTKQPLALAHFKIFLKAAQLVNTCFFSKLTVFHLEPVIHILKIQKQVRVTVLVRFDISHSHTNTLLISAYAATTSVIS